MLATRIIPTLLFRGDQLVKGERFQSWRSVGHIQQAAKIYEQRGVDELIVLDIAATPEGRGPDFGRVRDVVGDMKTPVTVGGGVRSIEDVDQLLRNGADKVAINTAAYHDGAAFTECARRFGSQAITAAIDVRLETIGYQTVTNCGQYVAVLPPVLMAESVEKLGAGEILLTSIDREGTMSGYDLDLIREVSRAVDIPVIAHGGCSGPADMLAAIKAGASAVAAGALFQFTDHTPRSCAEYLRAQGVEVRL